MKTIAEIVVERSLDRSTLLKAAQRGAFGEAARKSGDTWLIDDASLAFEAWYRKHLLRGEDIQAEPPDPPAWVNTDAARHAWKVNINWRVNAARTSDQDGAWRMTLLREADMYNR